MPSVPIAGVASFTIDGVNFGLKGELKYDSSTAKNEIISGQSAAVLGYKRTLKPGLISAKLTDDGTVTLRTFQDMVNVTVVAVLVNGKTVSGYGLVYTGDGVEADTEEGTFDVKFEGPVEEG